MKPLWFLMLGVLPWSVQAQQGEVRVFDSVMHQPLPSVNIVFESLHDGHRQYAVTNSYGLARNLCDDSCVVRVSCVGYRMIRDTVVAGEDITFFPAEDVFGLGQVVVTATRSRKALKDVPVITQVIGAQDIAGRGLTDVRDVLEQDIPGVEFRRSGFGADMHIQGLGAKNILILVDGERLAGETGYNVDYSRLNTADIDHIEVVKGAASALYGSQAMGGVINIITKKSRKRWEVNAGGRWSERNERNYPGLENGDDLYTFKKNLDRTNYNLHLAAGFRGDHLSSRTTVVAKSFDAYKLYDKEPVVKEFINIDTVITGYLNPFPTGINGYRDRQITQKIAVPVTSRLDIALRGSYYDHDEYDFVPDKVHQRYMDYTAGGQMVWQPGERVKAVASFNYDRYAKYDRYEKLAEQAVNYRNTFVDPRLTFNIGAGKHQEVTAGTEYFSESLFSGKLFSDTTGIKSSATWILFAQDDIDITGALNVVAGMRLDVHSAYGAHLSPKVSVMYRLRPLTFRLNYARGFRSPSLKELYIDWAVAWFTIRGDEHLRPETNNYLSGSVEFIRDHLDLSVTGYYNRLKDKIDGVWREGQTVYQYVNVREAEISGAEVMARLRAGRHFIVSGAYSYLHDKRPQGELVSAASPHTGYVKVNYRLRRGAYRLNALLSVNITGAKHFVMSDYLTYRGEYVEGFYPVHFDPWAIWRLSVSQHFLHGVNITAGVDNLFDHTPGVVSFNTSMNPGRKFFISMEIGVDELFNNKKQQINNN